MADFSILTNELTAKLQKLPKPVSIDDISVLAASVLKQPELGQFQSWLTANGERLIGKLNG